MGAGMIFLILLGVFVLYGIAKYNAIITMKNNRENAFADVDVQLKQRFDLIPNLVNTVKGYAKHEQETLTMVIEARNKYLSAGNIGDKIDADNQITGALRSLFALSESYPELKANENFLQLQDELSDVENKLAAARRFFNSSTKEYNNSILVFPANIIAGLFHFTKEPYFETPEVERQAPKVEF